MAWYTALTCGKEVAGGKRGEGEGKQQGTKQQQSSNGLEECS